MSQASNVINSGKVSPYSVDKARYSLNESSFLENTFFLSSITSQSSPFLEITPSFSSSIPLQSSLDPFSHSGLVCELSVPPPP